MLRIKKSSFTKKIKYSLYVYLKKRTKSVPVNALAAIFDLEGFTKFCTQTNPQLAVPKFLDLFLQWLFRKIKETCIKEELPDGYKIYLEPPFFQNSWEMEFCFYGIPKGKVTLK